MIPSQLSQDLKDCGDGPSFSPEEGLGDLLKGQLSSITYVDTQEHSGIPAKGNPDAAGPFSWNNASLAGPTLKFLFLKMIHGENGPGRMARCPLAFVAPIGSWKKAGRGTRQDNSWTLLICFRD